MLLLLSVFNAVAATSVTAASTISATCNFNTAATLLSLLVQLLLLQLEMLQH
jgi:hypothetical protein